MGTGEGIDARQSGGAGGRGAGPTWWRDVLSRAGQVPDFMAKEAAGAGPTIPGSKLRAAMVAALRIERDHGHLFFFVPVLLGAGAVLWFSLSPPSGVVLLGAFAMAILVLVVAARRGGVASMAATATVLILAGMLLADFETRRRATVVIDAPVTTWLAGTVETREIGPAGDWRYVVAIGATREPVLVRPPQRVTLVARARHEPFEIGAAIEGRARLSPPSGPALPGLNDFAFASYFKGIGAVGYFLGAPTPAVAGRAESDGVKGLFVAVERYLHRLRGDISERIRAVSPGDAGAFAAAIVTGDRRAMSKETVEALRISGLAHIISISGLHMALASGLFFVGLRVLLSLSVRIAHGFPTKKIAAIGALMAASIYLLISGGEVAAVRAYLMMAVMLMAVLVDRPAISMRNLALAALVVVAVWPSQVMGPSFQMSFAATAALIAGYAVLARRPRDDGLLPAGLAPPALAATGRLLGGIFVSSLIGGLSTALFAVEHFHRVGLYGLPANLMAMPLVSFVVMPAGLAAMILMPFGLDYYPIKIMGFGLELVIAMAGEVARWGGHGGVERLPAWFLPIAACGLIVLVLLRTWLRHVGTLTLILAIGALALLPRPPPGRLLVSEDGLLVALVETEMLASNRARPSSFLFDQWQEALLRPRHGPPEIMRDAGLEAFARDRAAEMTPALLERAAGLMDQILSVGRIPFAPGVDQARGAAPANVAATQRQIPTRFHCIASAFCLARLEEGTVIATVEQSALVGLACDRADLVITPRRLSFRTCRSGAVLISAIDLRMTGALEITPLKTGRFHVRAAMPDTSRPWQIHRRYDWRERSFDQTALDDVLARLSDSGE